MTLASAKRNSEVWAFSADVAFGPNKSSASLKFLLFFIAKTRKLLDLIQPLIQFLSLPLLLAWALICLTGPYVLLVLCVLC